jgi:hypothetical protein
MKKFSRITNQKVNEEPKVENKVDESSLLKVKMVNLMDQLLKIQSYGPVDNRFLTGSVKIQGKEMLAEALLDLLSEKSIDDKTKVLEGLKNKIRDWETIDNEIESIKKSEVSLNNKSKFSKILEKYKDEETLLLFLESKIPNIKDSKTISDYKELTINSNLNKETKSKILDLIYNKKF